MHEFSVWAPYPDAVKVRIGEAEYPMTCTEGGWWRVSVDVPWGTDYTFLLGDDPTPFPDPRGLRQPKGVHGPSQTYNQKAFPWTDGTWAGAPLSGGVIYEIHVGTFTPGGTFDSAIERLPYLADLGITHIELMPIAEFPGEFGWGYDGVAFFAVTENYGGPDALKRFVDACHQNCLSVVLDVVYNHFGPVGNYANNFGPYLTTRHHTPWGDAINFEEGGSDEVRRYFCDNALMWMRDFHIDGLRLDAVHEYMDRSAIHFMEQLSSEVEVLSSTLGRDLVLIAESDLNDPRVVTPREASGFGMDAQWSDDFHHSLFTVLYKSPEGMGYYDDFGTMEDLAKSLKEVFVYDGIYSSYRKRTHGRPAVRLSAHHFVGFIQNHDQVGNRATGDRIEHIIGMPRSKVAAAVVLLAPFLPMIFQGEEYAADTPFQYFAHHEDPAIAKSVSEGRKKDFAVFGWNPEEVPDPEKRETFERSKLNWNEITEGRHAEMLDWTRKLIHLRRSSPSLNDGDLSHIKVRFDEEKRWLSMKRGAVRLICNLGTEVHRSPNPERLALVLRSAEDVTLTETEVVLPPDTVAILSNEIV